MSDQHCHYFADGSLGIKGNGTLVSYCDKDFFNIPKNSEGMHEITEENSSS